MMQTQALKPATTVIIPQGTTPDGFRYLPKRVQCHLYDTLTKVKGKTFYRWLPLVGLYEVYNGTSNYPTFHGSFIQVLDSITL